MPPKKKASSAALKPYPGRERGYPLCEKYAPKGTDELGVAVHAGTVNKVRDWIRGAVDPVPGEPMRRLLILCGQPGIGKSTTVQVLCSELGVDLKRWGDTYGLQAYDKRGGREASDYRELSYESQLAAWSQFIRESRYGTLVGKKRSHDEHKTVLLLDDLPGQQEATSALLESFYGDENDDSLAAAAVLVWSSGISEKSEARLVVERLLGASLLARPSVLCLECNPVTEKKVAKVLSAIAKAESKTLPQRALDMLSAQAQGDLRKAITSLDFAMSRRFRPLANDAVDDDGNEEDDEAAKNGVVCDVHAIGRLLRAKRRDTPGAPLDFNPERVIERVSMGVDATAAFLQFNCVDFFSDDDELATALADFSTAELFTAKLYSTAAGHDRADPNYPTKYAESIASRTVAVANTIPAPSRFRPVRKPRHYEIAVARRANLKVDLETPHRLRRMPLPLAEHLPSTNSNCLEDDDIEDFDD